MEEPSTQTPDAATINAAIIKALADVQAVSTAEVEQEIANNGGSMAIDSVTAVCVLARLSEVFKTQMPGPEALPSRTEASTQTLADLVTRKLTSRKRVIA